MFVLVGGAYFERRLDRRRPTFHFTAFAALRLEAKGSEYKIHPPSELLRSSPLNITEIH